MFTEKTSHGSDRCRALVNSLSALLLMRNTSYSCEIKGSQTSSTKPSSKKTAGPHKVSKRLKLRGFLGFHNKCVFSGILSGFHSFSDSSLSVGFLLDFETL